MSVTNQAVIFGEGQNLTVKDHNDSSKASIQSDSIDVSSSTAVTALQCGNEIIIDFSTIANKTRTFFSGNANNLDINRLTPNESGIRNNAICINLTATDDPAFLEKHLHV